MALLQQQRGRTMGVIGMPHFTLAAKSNTLSGLGGSGALFGPSESPRTMLTRQYSIKAINTNLKKNNGQEIKYITFFLLANKIKLWEG
jgi:hypothetical protein